MPRAVMRVRQTLKIEAAGGLWGMAACGFMLDRSRVRYCRGPGAPSTAADPLLFYVTLTSICFVHASSRFGSIMVSTPSLKTALTLLGSM